MRLVTRAMHKLVKTYPKSVDMLYCQLQEILRYLYICSRAIFSVAFPPYLFGHDIKTIVDDETSARYQTEQNDRLISHPY